MKKDNKYFMDFFLFQCEHFMIFPYDGINIKHKWERIILVENIIYMSN